MNTKDTSVYGTFGITKHSFLTNYLWYAVYAVIICLGWVWLSTQALCQEQQDTADLDVEIKNRLYKTRSAFDIGVHGGAILNHPYIQPWTIHGTANYYITRSIGVGLDYTHILNKDKPERICVENFYNTFNHENLPLSSVCAGDGNPETAKKELAKVQNSAPPIPNMGPAYPPIRELNMIIQAAFIWSPIYGKLLFFMSQVVHFSTFVSLAGGVTINTHYPGKSKSSTGKSLRGSAPAQGISATISELTTPGVSADEVNEYGKAGRPDSQKYYTPTVTISIGQKFYVTKNINLHLEGRSMFLIGTGGSKYEVYFALLGGLGLRI
ncbi:MAG: hypothetical protein OXC44_05990 [Proteobacteria bacterium]|nr:hypothetical protein [Pseudomonadota bacterium]